MWQRIMGESHVTWRMKYYKGAKLLYTLTKGKPNNLKHPPTGINYNVGAGLK